MSERVRNRIKKFLDERGSNPRQLHQKAGIAQGTAYHLYNDQSYMPSLRVFQKIWKAYGVKFADLVDLGD